MTQKKSRHDQFDWVCAAHIPHPEYTPLVITACQRFPTWEPQTWSRCFVGCSSLLHRNSGQEHVISGQATNALLRLLRFKEYESSEIKICPSRQALKISHLNDLTVGGSCNEKYSALRDPRVGNNRCTPLSFSVSIYCHVQVIFNGNFSSVISREMLHCILPWQQRVYLLNHS